MKKPQLNCLLGKNIPTHYVGFCLENKLF